MVILMIAAKPFLMLITLPNMRENAIKLMKESISRIYIHFCFSLLTPPLQKIFDSYLNNGATQIFFDFSGNLSIQYLAENFFKNLTQKLHR